MSENCGCEICSKGVKCRKCGARMKGGDFKKKKDGTEIREIRCPKCGERSMEVKTEWDVFGEAESREDLALGIFR